MRFTILLLLTLSLYGASDKYSVELKDSRDIRGYWKMIGTLGVYESSKPQLQELSDSQIDGDSVPSIGVKENGDVAKSSSHTPENLVSLTASGQIKSVTIQDINSSGVYISTDLGEVQNSEPNLQNITIFKKVDDPLSTSSDSYFTVGYDSSLEGKTFNYFVEGFDGNRSGLYSLEFSNTINIVSGTPVTTTITQDEVQEMNVTELFDMDLSTDFIEPITVDSGELLLYGYQPNPTDGKYWPVYNSKNSAVDSNDFYKLIAGRGYWAKFDSSSPEYISGFRLSGGDNEPTLYSSTIESGWNLIALPDLKAIQSLYHIVVPYTVASSKISLLKVTDSSFRSGVVDINRSKETNETVIDINSALESSGLSIYALHLDGEILLYSDSEFSIESVQPLLSNPTDSGFTLQNLSSDELSIQFSLRREIEDVNYTIDLSLNGSNDFYSSLQNLVNSVDFNGTALVLSDTQLDTPSVEIEFNRESGKVYFPNSSISNPSIVGSDSVDSLTGFKALSGDTITAPTLGEYIYILQPNIDFINSSEIESFKITIGDQITVIKENNTTALTLSEIASRLTINGVTSTAISKLNDRDVILLSSKERVSLSNGYYISFYRYQSDPKYSNKLNIVESGVEKSITVPFGSTISGAVTALNSTGLGRYIAVDSDTVLSLSDDRFLSIEQVIDESSSNEIRPVKLLQTDISSELVYNNNFFKGYSTLNRVIDGLKRESNGTILYPKLQLFSNNRIDYNDIPRENNLVNFLNSINSNLLPVEVITTSTDYSSGDIKWSRIPFDKSYNDWYGNSSENYSPLFKTEAGKGYWVKFREKNSDDSQNILQIESAFFNREAIDFLDGDSLSNLIRGKVFVTLSNNLLNDSVSGVVQIGESEIPLTLHSDFQLFESYIDYRDLYQNSSLQDITEIVVKLYSSSGEVATESIPFSFKRLSKPDLSISYSSGDSLELKIVEKAESVNGYYKVYSNGVSEENYIDTVEVSEIGNFSFEALKNSLDFRVNYLDILKVDSLSESESNYSTVSTLSYVPLYRNTSRLYHQSSSTLYEDSIPDHFDSDGTKVTVDQSEGVVLKSYIDKEVHLFYQPVESGSVSLSDQSISDLMYISFDSGRDCRIKFKASYREKSFYIYNKTEDKLYKGKFENETYQYDTNPQVLTVVE